MSEEILVRRDGGGFIEFCNKRLGPDDWSYWILEKDVSTHETLLKWIEHMEEKNWITADHIQQLSDIYFEIQSIK